MTLFHPMRELPVAAGYGKNDVLVLFGELFGRGYANGIVEQARANGMKVVGATVGRRDADGSLRPLTDEELAAAQELLGGTIINIPLEAGFDMEPASDGRSPVDQLKGMKGENLEQLTLDWVAVADSRKRSIDRFNAAVAAFSDALQDLIPAGANVLFVHTMAGGMPRARLFMPILNKVFKGQGERYLSSEKFWHSDLGRLCKENFDEVTADTFARLIDGTEAIRRSVTGNGGRVSYAAYGYHGCEVLINGTYTWQSYTPYLQGWAKMRLEAVAENAFRSGIPATVFNSPEIQTNSSALFMGVEISLYPLLDSLQREGGADELIAECRSLLREEFTLEDVLRAADDYLSSPVLKPFSDYGAWPHHNTPEQAELMLSTSARLIDMNRNPKEIVCAALSRGVFTAVGRIMFDEMWEPKAPVYWLNHDIIAKSLSRR